MPVSLFLFLIEVQDPFFSINPRTSVCPGFVSVNHDGQKIDNVRHYKLLIEMFGPDAFILKMANLRYGYISEDVIFERIHLMMSVCGYNASFSVFLKQ